MDDQENAIKMACIKERKKEKGTLLFSHSLHFPKCLCMIIVQSESHISLVNITYLQLHNSLSFKRREAHRGAEGLKARGARRKAKAHAL